MITVTAAEIQNNFAKYLQAVQSGDEVLILADGKGIARIIPQGKSVISLTESFVGILPPDDRDWKEIRDEIYDEKRKKYEDLG